MKVFPFFGRIRKKDGLRVPIGLGEERSHPQEEQECKPNLFAEFEGASDHRPRIVLNLSLRNVPDVPLELRRNKIIRDLQEPTSLKAWGLSGNIKRCKGGKRSGRK